MPRDPDDRLPRELTKAEEWRTGDLARSLLDGVNMGTAATPQFIEALSRLMAGAAVCMVDAPLKEAIDRGFLSGSLVDLKWTATNAALLAYAETSAIYSAQLARPGQKDRQKVALRLARQLRDFLDDTEEEASQADHAAAKLEFDAQTEPLWAMLEHGEPLVALLEKYAASTLPEVPGGPRTDHEAGPFGRALADWWDANALDRGRHGAEAVRNRIAAALWTDLGRSFPDASTPQAWAERWLG